MNPTCRELSDEEIEMRLMESKRRRLEMDAVAAHFASRQTVSETARIMACSRNKVIYYRHVLGLETQRGRGRGRGLGAWPRFEAVQARR